MGQQHLDGGQVSCLCGTQQRCRTHGQERICAAIIALARELKLRVIAEGVENLEQLEFLRHHRCDQVQGYLMSPAVPIDELEKLLRATPEGTGLFQRTLGLEADQALDLLAANQS